MNTLPCTFVFSGCAQRFRSTRGHTKHVRTFHSHTNIIQRPSLALSEEPEPQPVPDNEAPDRTSPPTSLPEQPSSPSHPQPRKIKNTHLTGVPCDENGTPLPPDAQPLPWTTLPNLLFRKDEMSTPNLNSLFLLWTSSSEEQGINPSPFGSDEEMHAFIDAIEVGDAPWQCLHAGFAAVGENEPSWKKTTYNVWYRNPNTVLQNMLDNPDFADGFDYLPYIHLDANGKRHWSDFFSGNFTWRQCEEIYAQDESTEGAMYCVIIVGSDKTTVSVATGHVEYHPLYISLGNLHNRIRCAHRGAVIPIGFLAIPKSDRRYDHDPAFRTFKWQLYHSSISAIFHPLKPAMEKPIIRRCPDGHFRRAIFGFGADIADYPEQVLLTGIVQNWCAQCDAFFNNLDSGTLRNHRTQDYTELLIRQFNSMQLWEEFGIDNDIVPFTNDFPQADIHEIITPDILHQLIKGTFKDHLVEWVGELLVLMIAAVPTFPELRQFPHGRCFKQWTGDDSKALMKVYLPALIGYVPARVLWCIRTFLDFCYIVRCQSLGEDDVMLLEQKVALFHLYREVFRDTGVCPTGFSLPCQHSMKHYPDLIRDFGAPNGLCSSITESRHITAVKKPWRRSNRHNALGQMLLTNQRLDKLTAQRANYVERGMAPPTHDTRVQEHDDSDDEGPVDEIVVGNVVLAHRRASFYPSEPHALGVHIQHPTLPALIGHFLRDQLSRSHADSGSAEDDLPIPDRISVFHSAVATFFAPSDMSGLHGMKRERICSTPSWRKKGPCRDCAYVVEDEEKEGFKGMSVVHVHLFFSFSFEGVSYPCALVEWFKKVSRKPDEDTGMWHVKYETHGRHDTRLVTVVHLNTFFHAAHLIPDYGDKAVPVEFSYEYSLNCFHIFYMNKYIDHHAFEMII
ncbi:hypothetical protein EV421DRAFT_1909618 [Armillaria borealis]|uniref:C2H2-type domain-containing protein n=1 Tax=Armillaria borealis TaxID=47425 RepID=A0AA39J4D0_9AGAR|nr:hypothetical protein EV421DRAFT_1909618 [Armillaria borealis]